MRLSYRLIFLIAVTFILSSCSPRYLVKHPDEEISGEKIVFAENTAEAKVKWRKNIGTVFLYKIRDDIDYLTGIGPAVLPDGNVYFQDDENMFALGAATGEIKEIYRKPEGHLLVILDHAISKHGEIIIPVGPWWRRTHHLLIIDSETKKSKIANAAWGTGRWLDTGKNIMVFPTESDYDTFFVVSRGLDPEDKIWEFNIKTFTTFHALEAYAGIIAVLYSEKGALFVEVYDLDTGKFIWQNQLKEQKTKKWSLGELLPHRAGYVTVLNPSWEEPYKNLRELWPLKEMFVTELYPLEEPYKLDGRVISLNPANGEINWTMSGAVRVIAKRYGENDNLFYLFKSDEPEIVYGVDPKTGEEKLRLPLKGYLYALQYLIVTPDIVFYPGVLGWRDTQSFQYNTFNAVDKKTGNRLWTLDFEDQSGMPIYEDGIFYFGKRGEYERFYSGNLWKYELTKRFRVTKDAFRKNLSKTAFAVDASTGKVLWKIKLEGGDEAYIEKLFVKDNMVFIKSLSGWLYAIEWEKPKQ